ncbi:pectinesterase family protein [Streptomyces sp. NBC_01390]|uniref:pectinesterase family protein n=1 Tax=Streptomyces sp. NBC_01390 TaxID=2903850 RepID=UPI003244C70D
MTNTERGLSRRSFLSAATAVAAAGALAGGVVMAGASSAGAATGADVEWRISMVAGSGPGTAQQGYAAMLNGIRTAMGARIPIEGALPIDVTDINGARRYIAVDLHAYDSSQFIRVFLRRSDAYFMGWRAGNENGGAVTWGRFFTLEDTAEAGGASALPDATIANTDTQYNGQAGYDSLRGQGASRETMQISPVRLNQAVLDLHNGAGIDSRTAAGSILQIIVAVAEATRMRQQARDTARAFYLGQAFALTTAHIAFHNNWGRLSRAMLLAVMAGTAVLAAPVEIAGIVIATVAVGATYLMTVHHSDQDTSGKHLLEGSLLAVSPYGDGDHWTVQAAIDHVPSSGANTIVIEKGVYHEVISVPKSKSWLTIKGVTGNRADVVIYNTRCHGMINPATGAQWGTQGSAVATFRPPNLTVQDLTISNTFDRAAHPEISPYETQAVAVAAMGDRQTYRNVAIWSHQDTLLVKGETPTTQARQWFVNCHIRGDVDFIFGSATAVIDRSTIQCLPWPNGTVLAPNTDQSNGDGILISSCTIKTDGVPNGTMHLGRPWLSTAEAYPRATVRNCDIGPGIDANSPWVDMIPGQPWTYRTNFQQYQNFGPGTNNSPPLYEGYANVYTVQKFLAGTDGWNPT